MDRHVEFDAYWKLRQRKKWLSVTNQLKTKLVFVWLKPTTHVAIKCAVYDKCLPIKICGTRRYVYQQQIYLVSIKSECNG